MAGKQESERLAYTREEAAKAAGVSIPTMTQWLARSDFPAIKVGRRWVIPCNAFKTWLDDQANNRCKIKSRAGVSG